MSKTPNTQYPIPGALPLLLVVALLSQAQPGKAQIGTVTIDTARPLNTFRPRQAFGAGVDGHEKGDIAQIYRPDNLAMMQSAGFGPLSYRLRTELGIEAWHWSPAGTWSDAAHHCGYFVCADTTKKPLLISNGYSLPRRGNTTDQANNRGYSRLDDGDPKTFWKSSPYLDSHYTRESDALHPQWIMLDFGAKVPLDALRIFWGTPCATRYRIEYRTAGDPVNFSAHPEGEWKAFPQGVVENGKGGVMFLRLARKPIATRYVRIVLLQSSKTAPPNSKDVRDGLGYVIREIEMGIVDRRGRFKDAVRHGKNNDDQTVTFASSTDPWHRAKDIDPNVEQPGFDTVFHSGLTNGLPLMTPVAIVYDTPDNAAAEIRYLKATKIPLAQIELGEEPDGQYLSPEDYGALYLQFADAIHAVAPELQLGGPGFQTDVTGWHFWPDRNGNTSWMNRFLRYMKQHNRMRDFNFFSFEWYPFDDVCAPPAPQLAQHSGLFATAIRSLERDGLTHAIPWIITEYGYSAFAGQAEVELPGAILNVEIAAQFLTLGGNVAYLYGFEPNEVIHEREVCDAWGNLMMIQRGENGAPPTPLPCYYGAKLLTQEWALPGDETHQIFPAVSDVRSAKGEPLVVAFVTRRPDGQWAILLLNKDPKQSHTAQIRFRNSQTGKAGRWNGPRHVVQYSPKQYEWKADGDNGHPIRNLPPETFAVSDPPDTPVALPAYSLTVIRGGLDF